MALAAIDVMTVAIKGVTGLDAIGSSTVATNSATGLNQIVVVTVGIVGPEGFSAFNYKSNVILTGDKNGVNKTFTFPYDIVEDSEQIFYNLPLLRDIDYTIINKTITLTENIPAPALTDRIWATCLKG